MIIWRRRVDEKVRGQTKMKNSSFKFKNVTSLLDVVDVDDEKGKH